MKALGLVVSDKNWPRDLLMQPTGTVWTTLIGHHPGIIPVKFGQIPISGSREEVVWTFPYIIQCKIVTPGRGQFWPQEHNLNNFGRGPLDDAIYQIWRFLKIAFWKPIFWPRDLLKQPTGTVWTTLIGIIPVKFGQNPISGYRGDVV